MVIYCIIHKYKPFTHRTLGGTIGISIGGAIYASELRRRLPKIPGYGSIGDISDSGDLSGLVHILVSALGGGLMEVC